IVLLPHFVKDLAIVLINPDEILNFTLTESKLVKEDLSCFQKHRSLELEEPCPPATERVPIPFGEWVVGCKFLPDTICILPPAITIPRVTVYFVHLFKWNIRSFLLLNIILTELLFLFLSEYRIDILINLNVLIERGELLLGILSNYQNCVMTHDLNSL